MRVLCNIYRSPSLIANDFIEGLVIYSNNCKNCTKTIFEGGIDIDILNDNVKVSKYLNILAYNFISGLND